MLVLLLFHFDQNNKIKAQAEANLGGMPHAPLPVNPHQKITFYKISSPLMEWHGKDVIDSQPLSSWKLLKSRVL